ncbi:hypothetical protein QR680_008597 [Steinernema hermaphroditum]|uniref:Heat shock factor-binding protein 1 n=1 Tax=Steinernema hermaphroditum TaxID=289476 RepID=A0AA39M8D5_9BILA|nr:hypothetical protein QR680_008597 [Steinernema hermaphroditum]
MDNNASTAKPEEPKVSAASDPKGMDDFSNLIQGLLQQTQDRFQNLSDQIIGRIDDMSKRIDDLEKNISDLMAQAGVEGDQ